MRLNTVNLSYFQCTYAPAHHLCAPLDVYSTLNCLKYECTVFRSLKFPLEHSCEFLTLLGCPLISPPYPHLFSLVHILCPLSITSPFPETSMSYFSTSLSHLASLCFPVSPSIPLLLRTTQRDDMLEAHPGWVAPAAGEKWVTGSAFNGLWQ